MIEKLLENWLINTNERGYMPAFCQLLVAEGYKLIYIASHGQDEAGKDIIAISPSGNLEAYQLKDGNINLSEYRLMRGELEELLKHPIIHPSISKKSKYTSYLLVNGRVGDPVRSRISQENDVNWGQGKSTKLKYIQREELIARFSAKYGEFFPTEPRSFKDFLEIFIDEGVGFFPKSNFCKILDQHFDVDGKNTLSKTKVASLISSSIILTNYLTTSWARKENFVSQIDAWICLHSYIYYSIEKNDLREKLWTQSIRIVRQIIDDLFMRLLSEMSKRKHLIEGDWATDSIAYGVRTSILLGYLSSYVLYKRLCGEKLDQTKEDEIKQLHHTYEDKMRYCGEASTPNFLSYYWFNKMFTRDNVADGRLSIVLYGLVSPKKAPEPFGFPNPYYGHEDALRIINGLNEDHNETFIGQPYSMWCIVQTFARHDNRTVIEKLWPMISKTQFLEIVPKKLEDFLRWEIEEADLVEKFPNSEQSWSELRKESSSKLYNHLPGILKKNPEFAVLLFQVFPHRTTPDLVELIDNKLLELKGN